MTTPPPLNPDTIVCPSCGHVNASWRSICENCGQGLTAGAAPLKTAGRVIMPKKIGNGLCDKCATRPGSPYKFYFLKRIYAGKTMKYADYRDGGSEIVSLCDKCVGKQRNKSLWQFGFFFFFLTAMGALALFFFTSILVRTGYFTAFLLAGGLVGVMIGLGSAWFWIKTARGGLQFTGTSLAIDIWKKWLTQQGFDTFLYEDEYQKLIAKK
jgi:hypothetical protein